MNLKNLDIKRLFLYILVFSGFTVFVLFINGCSINKQTVKPIDSGKSSNLDNLNKKKKLIDDELDSEDSQKSSDLQISDPLEPINRAIFSFNDKLYMWAVEPTAKGYRAITPQWFRTGLKNFFHNIFTPVRLINCVLQGKQKKVGIELGRFMVNTTLSLGFWDYAKDKQKLETSDEDLGQTLGYWGIGNGIYLMLPFFGPLTLRDSIGMAGEFFLNPFYYSVTVNNAAGIRAGIHGLQKINTASFQIGDYESFKKAALDPYSAFKDAYIQYRQKQIKE